VTNEDLDGPVALFPLSTVLFPGGRLPLRIFETRYIDMVRSCLRSDAPFGVVLIRTGSETGSARFFDVGTTARIVDWEVDGDGLLGISVRGEDRFVVHDSHRTEDGLYRGFVRLLDPEQRGDVPPELAGLGEQVDALLADIPASRRDPDDAIWLSYRLAERLPVDREFRQMLLECPTAGERLERMIGLIGAGFHAGPARQ